jgi:hypothetical protein
MNHRIPQETKMTTTTTTTKPAASKKKATKKTPGLPQAPRKAAADAPFHVSVKKPAQTPELDLSALDTQAPTAVQQLQSMLTLPKPAAKPKTAKKTWSWTVRLTSELSESPELYDDGVSPTEAGAKRAASRSARKAQARRIDAATEKEATVAEKKRYDALKLEAMATQWVALEDDRKGAGATVSGYALEIAQA